MMMICKHIYIMIIIIYNHHSDQNPKKTKITWVCSYYLKQVFVKDAEIKYRQT